jgi:hypothetical protein
LMAMLFLIASTFALMAMLDLASSTFILEAMLGLTALYLYWWLCFVLHLRPLYR